MIWATGVSWEGEITFIPHTCGFNSQCPAFQPLSISVMDHPSLLSLPKPRLEQRVFPKQRKYLSENQTQQPPRAISFFSSFFLIPFLQALSSNKQLLQSAALIKRNVLISPRLNIVLLCYHWSKSSKIQNKNVGLICSRSGMSSRNSLSLQVCPILRKKGEELKCGGWHWGHVAAGAGMPGSKWAKPNFSK